jgi:hypothetical protein
MNFLKKSLFPLALVCGGLLAYLSGTTATAFAPPTKPKLSPKAPAPHTLLVESTNPEASFKITLAVDHEDSSYSLGEEVIITVTSERDGYLYVFYADATGTMTALFPNQYQKSNEIKAGTKVVVPDPSDKRFRIKVAEPVGQDVIKAVVTTHPLKDLNTEELTRAVKPKMQMTSRQVKRLLLEAGTGDPKLGDNDQNVSDQINKQKQDHPEQIKQKCKEWAEASLILNTHGGKPAQDKPVQDKPVQDKPVQDKPTQDKPKQDKPAQDKPAQDKPAQDKPAQDKPAQDKPKQDKPAQDKPAQDKPAQDKPAQDKPAQDKCVGKDKKPPVVPTKDKPLVVPTKDK